MRRGQRAEAQLRAPLAQRTALPTMITRQAEAEVVALPSLIKKERCLHIASRALRAKYGKQYV